MRIIIHELKQSRKSVLIWTCAITFMLSICVFLFPEMKGQMEAVNDMFSSMGSFTAAFGMDRLNFGTFIGYYAIECGNVMGLGGAFFAALIAVSALAKEEKDRTAEFLLSHPVSRAEVITQKLISVFVSIVIMNVVAYGFSVMSAAVVGEAIPWKEVTLLHLAYFLMQIEIAGICFGISAFIRRGSLGIGLGFAVIMYFLNLMSNITSSADFLKYITPFGYTDGADIVTDGSLKAELVLLGLVYTVIGISVAYIKYTKKDIRI